MVLCCPRPLLLPCRVSSGGLNPRCPWCLRALFRVAHPSGGLNKVGQAAGGVWRPVQPPPPPPHCGRRVLPLLAPSREESDGLGRHCSKEERNENIRLRKCIVFLLCTKVRTREALLILCDKSKSNRDFNHWCQTRRYTGASSGSGLNLDSDFVRSGRKTKIIYFQPVPLSG